MIRFLLMILLLLFSSPCLAVGGSSDTTIPKQVLFKNVDVFDGKSKALKKGINVLVEGNLIKAVSKSAAVTSSDSIVIDAKGKTLMPGLIDMHWHSILATLPMRQIFTSDLAYLALVGAQANEDALKRGFTSVRDLGGNVFALAKATDQGLIPGPRIYPSGPYIGQTSGHGDFRSPHEIPANIAAPLDCFGRAGHSLVADGVPEVLKRTREALRMGATQIKVHAGGGVSSDFDPLDVTRYSLEEMKAIVSAAENWNTYVAVHVFTDEATQQAIEAGVKCIEHGHLLSEKTLQLMKNKGVWLSMQPILDDEDAIPFPEGSENRKKFIEVTKGTETVYKLAKKLGVKIVFGTDALFDPELAGKQGKMLAKLARWFTPYEALVQATSNAGKLLKLSGPRDPYKEGALGVIEEGAYADLILVNGNPLEDLSLVADPETNFALIMKNGEFYKNTL